MKRPFELELSGFVVPKAMIRIGGGEVGLMSYLEVSWVS
jgi:hypothetical protein